jgi:tetratricopeptide (TPR) repeat protein
VDRNAELLAAEERRAPALEALRQVRAGDPFAGIAQASRTQLLVQTGQLDTALAEARAAAERPGASVAEITRHADLLVEAKRHAEAAPLYARAIAMREGGAPGADLWLLHLLHGSALEEGGRWPEGKAALEAAYRIAPREPQVLNHLGYAQLERRENLDAAEALIREASRLQPDDASITDSLAGRCSGAARSRKRSRSWNAPPPPIRARRRSASIWATPIGPRAAASTRATRGARRCCRRTRRRRRGCGPSSTSA